MSDDHWSPYEALNDAIAEELFSGAFANRPVYIDLEGDVLARIAARVAPDADPREALIGAVAPVLQLQGNLRTFGRLATRRAMWRTGSMAKPPPGLGVLAVLSLAAEEMQRDEQFGAATYYRRLIAIVGGDVTNERLLARMRQAHRTDVQYMWSELNGWLELDQARGLPTAFAFDYRTLIGPAMSQAIVREADRQRLPDLFAEAGLLAGQEIGDEDMIELLKGWIPGSRLSRGLKRLAQQPGAIAQIAAVAIAELAAWDGGQAEPAGCPASSSEGIRLVARVRARPRPALSIRLLARLPEGHARLEIEGEDEAVELHEDEPGWSVVATERAASTLSHAVVVRAASTVARIPKPIVVLLADEDLARMVEVPRVLLGRRHGVLATEAHRSILERALEKVARPGWKIVDSIPGLPGGWLLIKDVQVVAVAELGNTLSALEPTGVAQVSLTGGFRLPGRARWLADDPPEVSVTVAEGASIDLEATLDTSPLEEDETDDDDSDEGLRGRVLARGIERPSAIDLADVEIGPGRHRLVAINAVRREPIASVTLTLLEPNPAVIADGIGHAPDGDLLWPIAAAEDGTLRGACVAHVSNSTPARSTPELPREIGVGVGPSFSDPEPAPFPHDAPECFRSGFHVFVLPDSRRSGMHVECKHCGMPSYIPPRRRARPSKPRQLRLPRLPPPVSLDEESILYAAGAVGGGSRRALATIIEQLDDEPWAVSVRGATLSALGHIDVALDRDARPARWAISPPVLSMIDDTVAVLCGWRSPPLVHALGHAVAQLGGSLDLEPQPEAPDRILTTGLDAEALGLVIETVHEQDSVEVALVVEAAERLASALPPLSSIVAGLRIVENVPDRLEWLRPDNGLWEPCRGMRTPGTYRSRLPPTRHYVYDGRRARACEARAARWLTRRRGQDLLAYDPEASVLAVPLGSRLPGLWERAACLSSGRAPRDVDGRHAYEGVSSRVAGLIAGALSVDLEGLSVA